MQNKNVKHRPSTKYLYFHKITGPTLFCFGEKVEKYKKNVSPAYRPTFFQHVSGNTASFLHLTCTVLLSYKLIRSNHIFFICRLANIFGRNHERSSAREMTINEKSNPSLLSKDESPTSKDMPTTTEDIAEERELTVELFEALNNLRK